MLPSSLRKSGPSARMPVTIYEFKNFGDICALDKIDSSC